MSQYATNPTRSIDWPAVDRPLKLAVASGIGDIHWMFLKLRGLLKSTGNDKHKPIIYVCSGHPSRDRTADFVRMIPWVEFGGYFDIREREKNDIAHQMFLRGILHKNKFGMDAFFSVNTLMEMGMQMDDIFPQAGPTDWDYPLNLRTEPVQELLDQSVRHVAVIFYKAGYYKEWWEKCHPCLYINELAERLQPDQKIAILGAGWDDKEALEIVKLTKKSSKLINLSGKTTFQQVMHVIKTADGFFGHPSGLGILAQHIKRPTTLIWGPHWQWGSNFESSWARPDMKSQGKYLARRVEEDPSKVVSDFIEQMR